MAYVSNGFAYLQIKHVLDTQGLLCFNEYM